MNELTEGSLSKGAYKVKFVSVPVAFPRIKFPYPNYFMIVDFLTDSLHSIC